MFNTQHGEYADPIVQREGEQEKASLQLGVIQRGNPLDKTGKELSWQGEEHTKLEMSELGIGTVIVITVRSRYIVLRILASFHSN